MAREKIMELMLKKVGGKAKALEPLMHAFDEQGEIVTDIDIFNGELMVATQVDGQIHNIRATYNYVLNAFIFRDNVDKTVEFPNEEASTLERLVLSYHAPARREKAEFLLREYLGDSYYGIESVDHTYNKAVFKLQVAETHEQALCIISPVACLILSLNGKILAHKMSYTYRCLDILSTLEGRP
jgi:hypothetical protein